ncbi:hypothetical protein Tco_0876300 [Tanacetum coccineum]|uniref:Reverse transcriptase domain-containing protein n=1 Tax=Tanacetum coccineum TaxID=301880 RepID=A0ABQ5BWY1_9ASTR
MTNTRSGMTHAAIEEMIDQRVNAALEAHQVNQNLELGNGNNNGNDNGNGNGNDNGNGNGNGNNGGDNGDGNENHNVNGRGDRLVARECTYQDFMKCQPTSFKGTEGVVGLIRWSEKMETVFHISNCPEKYQVKYATCTLLDSALTWWNSHKRTIGTDAAYALSWRELMKLMTEVPGTHMMCTKMVPGGRSVEIFFGGLLDNIQGNVIAVEPTRLQDVVRIANNLMDQKLKGYANTGGQNVARAYVAGNNEKIGIMRVPNARGKSYVLGGGNANSGSNTVMGTFLLNDHLAYMLFDSGADRSFISNALSTLLDITPYALDVDYAVKLANRRTS